MNNGNNIFGTMLFGLAAFIVFTLIVLSSVVPARAQSAEDEAMQAASICVASMMYVTAKGIASPDMTSAPILFYIDKVIELNGMEPTTETRTVVYNKTGEVVLTMLNQAEVDGTMDQMDRMFITGATTCYTWWQQNAQGIERFL